jgi:hypothetical protein
MITAKLAKNNFPQLQGVIRQIALQRINLAVIQAASLARQLCPVGEKPHPDGSPHMRDTIVVETYRGGELLRIRIKARYAAFVVQGHHAPDGSWVPPDLFLYRAIEELKKTLPRVLRDLTTNYLNG